MLRKEIGNGSLVKSAFALEPFGPLSARVTVFQHFPCGVYVRCHDSLDAVVGVCFVKVVLPTTFRR
jgi:hypothetical protein